MNEEPRLSPILAYYWLTPAFWILDEFLGANFRTAALDGHPWWKALYYLFCIGIALFATANPDWTARLGLLEARINIAFLVIGFLVPYYAFLGEMAEGEFPTDPPITMALVINFILASAIWFIALEMRKRQDAP